MHVFWLEQTAAGVPAEDDWLGPGEKETLSRLRFARRRADWRLGRWTAKQAVCACLNAKYSLPDIEIRAAASGAPEVFIRQQPAGVAISLSHRSGTAACAVAPLGTAIGCDLELVEERSDGFVADFFTEREQSLIPSLPAHSRNQMVTLIWSAKESALKAVRQGLRLDTRFITIAPGNGPGPWHPLRVLFPDCTFHGWWMQRGSLVRTLVTAPDAPPPIVRMSLPSKAK